MKTLKNKLKKQGGFTLVEMLTVVAIIAILIAISIPMVTGALDRAKAATDAANVRAAKATASIEVLTHPATELGVRVYDAATGQLLPSTETKASTEYAKHSSHTAYKYIWVTEKDDVIYYQWKADAPDAIDASNSNVKEDAKGIGNWSSSLPTEDLG